MGAHSAARSTTTSHEQKGRHRAAELRTALPYAWLGAGAVSLGIGAASIAGAAVAQADDATGGTTPASGTTAGSTTGDPVSGESASGETTSTAEPSPSTARPVDVDTGSHGPSANAGERGAADKPVAKVGDGRNGTTKSPPTSQAKKPDSAGSLPKTGQPPGSTAADRKTLSDNGTGGTGPAPKKPPPTSQSMTAPPTVTRSSTVQPAAAPSPSATTPSTQVATSFLAATADPPKPVDPVAQSKTAPPAATKMPPAATTATPKTTTTPPAKTTPAVQTVAATSVATPQVQPVSTPATTPTPSLAPAPAATPDVFAPIRDWIFKTFLNQTPTVSVVPGQTILANGTIKGMVVGDDADGDVLTYTASTPTGGGTVEIADDGSYVYTPGAGFTGADAFTVSVSDDTPVNGWHVHGLLGLLFPGLGSTASTNVSVVGRAVTPTNPTPPSTGSASAAANYGWGNPVTGLSDEFDGTGTPDSFWNLYRSAGHAGNGLRRPEQITEQNGYLQIAGTSNATSGGMMSSAVYPAYGRWEVRMRVDKQGPGNPYHSVVALIPYGVPYANGAGDLDFSEADVDDGLAYVFVHHPTNKQSYASVPLDLARWHTYSIEVAPDHISWFVDGKVQMTTTNRAAITGTRWTTNVQLDAFYPGGLAPSNMQVDYFRFYQLPATGAPIVPAPAPAIGNYA